MNRKHRLLNYFILLTCIILLNSGCAGMVGRSMMVGDLGSYSELSDSLSAIPEGKGRVFIYMTDGGPSLMNTMGVVGEPLSIDNDVYFFAGETFFFVDLDIGKHKITATNMTSGFVKRTFHLGENALDIVISNQDVKYIKIDMKGNTAKFYPTLIESNQSAKNEISNLKLFKFHPKSSKSTESNKSKVKIGHSYY